MCGVKVGSAVIWLVTSDFDIISKQQCKIWQILATCNCIKIHVKCTQLYSEIFNVFIELVQVKMQQF